MNFTPRVRRSVCSLRRFVLRLACRWEGHEQNWANMDECDRCGQLLSYDDWVRDTWEYRLRMTGRRLMQWIGPCPDCGMICGRHDANKQHLPF
jgi:hypothetical protein